jgi:hypothetical protein
MRTRGQRRGRAGYQLIVRLLVMPLLSMSVRAVAQEGPSGKTVLAGGLGASVGVLGGRVARRLGDLPLAALLGVGIEGIAPQLQIDVLSMGDLNLHVSGGMLYEPWEGLIFSQGSLLTIAAIGVQRWPFRWQHGGLFLNGDVEIVRQVRGTSEGGHEHQWQATVGGQIGGAF